MYALRIAVTRPDLDAMLADWQAEVDASLLADRAPLSGSASGSHLSNFNEAFMGGDFCIDVKVRAACFAQHMAGSTGVTPEW